MKRVKIGIIGCGNISDIYFQSGQTFEILEIVACADLIAERAQVKASQWNIPKVCTPQELLADEDIQIVVNLTIPQAHYEVASTALEAGKCVHNEKPLAISREEGKRLVDIARSKKLLLGSAPDTFLGGGLQTCRKLIEDGWIGIPIAASAFMTCHGHESWHPDPEFYYKVGGGPLFDMGPYYLTALIHLMGPVRRVTGATKTTFPERLITSPPKFGTRVQVEVPTHVAGILEFDSGATGTILTTFDIWAAQLPRIEIYGTEGSLSVPDPNGFGGPVAVFRAEAGGWGEVPLTHGYTKNSRGIGVADMAYALHSGRVHRTSGDLAYHVLDIMHAIHEAAAQGRYLALESTSSQPKPLPLGLRHGVLDD